MARTRTESLIIAQSLLVELQEARNACHDAEAVERRLRREVLDRADAGALIQPGPLLLHITNRERTSFSRANLVQAFGEDRVIKWAERLPRTLYRQVVVQGRNRLRPFSDDDSW